MKKLWYYLEELPEYPALSLEVGTDIARRLTEWGFFNTGGLLQRYQNGSGMLYVQAGPWDRASKAMVRAINRNPDLYVRQHRRILQIGKKLKRICDHIYRIDLTRLNNRELAKEFKSLHELYSLLHLSRCPAWIMETRFEYLSKRLLHELQGHLHQYGIAEEATIVLATLSTPTHKVLINNEVDDLLALADHQGRVSSSALKAHLRKYWYLSYGQVGPGMNKKELLQRIHEARNKNPHAELQLRRMQHTHLLRERRHLRKVLRLPSHLEKSMRVAELIGYGKSWSKEVQFYGYAMRDKIGREIERRFERTLRQFWWMLPDEVSVLIEQDRGPSRSELNRRWKDSWLLMDKKGMRFIKENEQRDFFSTNKLEQKIRFKPGIRQLRGMPAVQGSGAGMVKVINSPAEMKKMKHGNILVSTMTIPEIIPAMRLASAIITDEGGLTCHAAIVARELGIPCVIGTKVATQVLKDGDRVEVDATKGIVKRI
ncbi:MAG: PEP-utilizing enzyme [bacterium]